VSSGRRCPEVRRYGKAGFRPFRRAEFLRLCFRPSPYTTRPKEPRNAAIVLCSRKSAGQKGRVFPACFRPSPYTTQRKKENGQSRRAGSARLCRPEAYTTKRRGKKWPNFRGERCSPSTGWKPVAGSTGGVNGHGPRRTGARLETLKLLARYRRACAHCRAAPSLPTLRHADG